MLTFEDRVQSDGFGCFLWADEPALKRVRFGLGTEILEDVLHAGNGVNDDANVAVCERERPRIEAACRRAFAARPSGRVELEPSDFD